MGRSLLRAIKQITTFQRLRKRWPSFLISKLGNSADLMATFPAISELIDKGACTGIGVAQSIGFSWLCCIANIAKPGTFQDGSEMKAH